MSTTARPDRPTRLMVMLDYVNRPAGQTVTHLTRMASQYGGKFLKEMHYKGFSEWYLVFSFDANNQVGVEEFWNRALMYNDLTESN